MIHPDDTISGNGPTGLHTMPTGEWVYDPTGDSDGILFVRLWSADYRSRGRRRGARGVESRFYQVQYTGQHPDGHHWLLMNQTPGEPSDLNNPGPYECVIGPRSRCTCTAGQCRVPTGCVHRWALAGVVGECASQEAV